MGVNFKLKLSSLYFGSLLGITSHSNVTFIRALPTSSPKKSEKKKVEISSESETSSSDDSEDELLLPRRCRAQVKILIKILTMISLRQTGNTSSFARLTTTTQNMTIC